MSKTKIMINGLPGNLAGIIAAHALKDSRFEVIPVSLTGPGINEKSFLAADTEFSLIGPDDRETEIKYLQAKEGNFITIDYTHPSAVNDNVSFYCRNKLPFVMGTTGGDRELIRKNVTDSDIPAVIAPNMAKQIVGLQAMMAYAAETFPGLFSGYTLEVKESHQSWKADTSGTAKAMIRYFNELGVDFTPDRIKKERNPEIQKNVWGIPEEYLDGHGWHTYTLDSPEKTARFAITHNISGREIYGEGTLDAALYLAGKLAGGARGIVFSMIDVLKQK